MFYNTGRKRYIVRRARLREGYAYLQPLMYEREKPLPRLREKLEDVGEICLARRRLNNFFYGDAEIRKGEHEDEYPEDEAQHVQ